MLASGPTPCWATTLSGARAPGPPCRSASVLRGLVKQQAGLDPSHLALVLHVRPAANAGHAPLIQHHPAPRQQHKGGPVGPAVPRHAMPRHAMPRNAMPRHAMPRHAAQAVHMLARQQPLVQPSQVHLQTAARALLLSLTYNRVFSNRPALYKLKHASYGTLPLSRGPAPCVSLEAGRPRGTRCRALLVPYPRQPAPRGCTR